jgi:hypothetical protein
MVMSREEVNAKRRRNYAISQRKMQEIRDRRAVVNEQMAANRKRANRREVAAGDAQRRR